MSRPKSLEDIRRDSINTWTSAQRQAIHEAVRNTPVGQPADGIGVGAGGSNFREPALKLVFNSVEGAQYYVQELESVDSWNSFFELPDNGNPFTKVEVDGATIFLYGGSEITMKRDLFDGNNSLIAVDDQIGCVVTLGQNVFGNDEGQGSTNLESVNFPTVTEAGAYCFFRCLLLTSVTMPLLTTTGRSCFRRCDALTNISLPQLTTAATSCFERCYSLTSINLPVLTDAGFGSFSYCESLTSINLPLLTDADGYCFNECESITSVNLPQVTTTGIYCFSNCTSLKDVKLPVLQTVGDYCFYNCTSLKSLMLPSCLNLGESVLDNGVFNSITNQIIKLRVPAALMTCNIGNPDGDIQYLQANNTVTITQV